MENSEARDIGNDRRAFLKGSACITLLAGAGSIGLLSGCKENDKDVEVSPPEDLMQEHGLLNRVLLIYDHCKTQLSAKQEFDLNLLNRSAQIIRQFVEDYHEKQEEDHLFTRFEKAHTLVDLVATLRTQHKAGRAITDQIIQLTKNGGSSDPEKLIRHLTDFNTMYRPHEAREDTVLFPAFRKLVSKHEYDSLGEEFEDNEHKLFGKEGFENFVFKVAQIERGLGIYELASFTPK